MNYLLCWHAHHETNFPMEFIWQSFDARVAVIKTVKAKEETPQQIAVRLKLFKPFEGELPAVCRAEYEEWLAAALEWKPAEQEYYSALSEARASEGAPDDQYSAAAALLALAEKRKIEVWPRYEAARVEFMAAIQVAKAQLMKLHKEQCGCGWTRKLRNIFDYMGEDGPIDDGDNYA